MICSNSTESLSMVVRKVDGQVAIERVKAHGRSLFMLSFGNSPTLSLPADARGPSSGSERDRHILCNHNEAVVQVGERWAFNHDPGRRMVHTPPLLRYFPQKPDSPFRRRVRESEHGAEDLGPH